MAHSTFNHLRAPRTHWWFVFASGVLTLVCGTIGFMQLGPHDTSHVSAAWARLPGAVYSALQMLILHTPHFEKTNAWLEVGRWIGAFTLVTSTVFLLSQRLRHEWREFTHRFWRGHYIVCGLGDRGFAIARKLVAESGAKVVIVDPEPSEERMLECETLGMFVVSEDATTASALTKACVRSACEIIVVTDSDETNVRVGLAVTSLVAADAGPQCCRVHLSDINLREILQRAASKNAVTGGTKVEFFDVFEQESKGILAKLDVAGAGDKETDKREVRLVILGFGRMGRSVALQAAQLRRPGNGKPLQIVVIDRDGEAQRQRFLFRHPDLADKLEFKTAEAESAKARGLVEGYAKDRDTRLHVFVCVDENTRAAEISLRLKEVLSKSPGCTLAVRIKSRESLGAIFAAAETGAGNSGPKIEAFGMVEDWAASDA